MWKGERRGRGEVKGRGKGEKGERLSREVEGEGR